MRTSWPEAIEMKPCSQLSFFSLALRKPMNQNNWDQAIIATESLLGCSWLSFFLAGGRNGLQDEQRSSPDFACCVTGEVTARFRGKGSPGAGEWMHDK